MALRMLMERGYANLNMDELAEEVGISKPTLYQYFNSKDELIAKAFVHMLERMEEQLLEMSGSSPLGQLEQFLRSMLKGRAQQQSAFGMVDIEAIRAIVFRNPYVVDQVRATRSKLLQVVQKAQERGEIDPAIPDWVVVNMMFSMQSAINNRFMRDETQRSSEEIADAIEGIIMLFKRGVSAAIPMPDSATPR